MPLANDHCMALQNNKAQRAQTMQERKETLDN
jgi:hypothetical protein